MKVSEFSKTTDPEFLKVVADLEEDESLTGGGKDRLHRIAARLEQLERENAELKEAVKERSRFSQCIYCGDVFNVGSVDNADEAAKAHIQQCEKHPIYKLKQEIAALKHPALGPNPTVAEIVRDYLKRGGYEGIYCDMGQEWNECQCFDGDPLKHDQVERCRAGYIQPDGSVGPEKKR